MAAGRRSLEHRRVPSGAKIWSLPGAQPGAPVYGRGRLHTSPIRGTILQLLAFPVFGSLVCEFQGGPVWGLTRAGPRTSRELMFDHVKFGVSDYAASKAFFLKALEPLGVTVVSEGPPTYGVELSPKGKASLCLYQTEEKPAHLHLAFTAENRQQVEAFYRAALEAGGKDNGAPGLCPEYHANYYAAFVIGPDGHNIEVVCHEPEA